MPKKDSQPFFRIVGSKIALEHQLGTNSASSPFIRREIDIVKEISKRMQLLRNGNWLQLLLFQPRLVFLIQSNLLSSLHALATSRSSMRADRLNELAIVF